MDIKRGLKRSQETPSEASVVETSLSIPAQSLSKSPLRAFASLRQRNFRLYWFGQLISLLGTWMQGIGQVWLVLQLTHNPVLLGLVGALQYLPVLLFSLFTGVFADRWPKRRILLVTQTVAMLQSLALWLLVLTGTVQLWHIYILALVLGLTNSLTMPTTQAFVVEMVGRENVSNAIGLTSSLTHLARMLGPAIGGFIIAASGVTSLFLLNTLSFLAVLIALLLMDGKALFVRIDATKNTNVTQNTWQGLREGLAYVQRTPVVLLAIVIGGFVLLFGSNFDVFLPLFATEVLSVGAKGYGILAGSISAGSLLASMWLAWSKQKPTVSRVLVSASIFGVIEIFFTLSRLYPLSLILIAMVGFLEVAFAALATTTIQTVVPDALRGRVMSVTILFFTGSVPPGYLLAGWLSSLYGAPLAMLLCALLSLLVVGVGWVWLRQTESRAVC